MQFYGYLRRNPDDEPDNNFAGYDFWIAMLDQFSLPGEDVRDAGGHSSALGKPKWLGPSSFPSSIASASWAPRAATGWDRSSHPALALGRFRKIATKLNEAARKGPNSSHLRVVYWIVIFFS